MKTKEQVYDDEIHPLIDQVVKICQENKIQMISSFMLQRLGPSETLMATHYVHGSEQGNEISIAKGIILRGLKKETMVTDYVGNLGEIL